MIITPEDSRWLNSLANAYRTEVAQTPVSLQESQAKNLYNIIEGIQTALQVDLSEAQVQTLISALSEKLHKFQRQYDSQNPPIFSQENLRRRKAKRLPREIKFAREAGQKIPFEGEAGEFDTDSQIFAKRDMERAQNFYTIAGDIANGTSMPSVEAIKAAGRKPGQLPGVIKKKNIKLNRARPNQTPRGTVPNAPTTAAKADRKVEMDQQDFSR